MALRVPRALPRIAAAVTALCAILACVSKAIGLVIGGPEGEWLCEARLA